MRSTGCFPRCSGSEIRPPSDSSASNTGASVPTSSSPSAIARSVFVVSARDETRTWHPRRGGATLHPYTSRSAPRRGHGRCASLRLIFGGPELHRRLQPLEQLRDGGRLRIGVVKERRRLDGRLDGSGGGVVPGV